MSLPQIKIIEHDEKDVDEMYKKGLTNQVLADEIRPIIRREVIDCSR